MDIRPAVVAHQFNEIIKSRYPNVELSPANIKEDLFAQELVKLLDQLVIESYFEEDEEVIGNLQH